MPPYLDDQKAKKIIKNLHRELSSYAENLIAVEDFIESDHVITNLHVAFGRLELAKDVLEEILKKWNNQSCAGMNKGALQDCPR